MTYIARAHSVMPSLAGFFTCRQVLINRRQMPEIRCKSVLIHKSDNSLHYKWIIKDAIWWNRRCVADTRSIFAMLNIWSCQRFIIMLGEWVLTEKSIRGGLLDHIISVILPYFLITSCMSLAVVCGSDRVVGDSSYCKVMQCVTSCRRSIVQYEHSSDWMLPR